jgi:hypothetical protein
MKKKATQTFDFFLYGPISLPEFNTAFHSVASSLRRQGFTVASPIEAAPDSVCDGFPSMLRIALPLLCVSKKVVLLSNAGRCPMAKLLIYMAQRLQLEFYDVTSMAALSNMQLRITFSQAVGDTRRARELLEQTLREEEW